MVNTFVPNRESEVIIRIFLPPLRISTFFNISLSEVLVLRSLYIDGNISTAPDIFRCLEWATYLEGCTQTKKTACLVFSILVIWGHQTATPEFLHGTYFDWAERWCKHDSPLTGQKFLSIFYGEPWNYKALQKCNVVLTPWRKIFCRIQQRASGIRADYTLKWKRTLSNRYSFLFRIQRFFCFRAKSIEITCLCGS